MQSGTGLDTRDQMVIELGPETMVDPLIEAFKKDVDRTLLIDNLRRTFDQRARRMNEFIRALDELHKIQPSRCS